MANREIATGVDDYAAKLAKLIPAEVAAAYLSINSLVPNLDTMDWRMWGSMAVLTVFCPLYLWRLQNVRGWAQIAFTTAVFPLWALNISSARLSFDPTTLGVCLILVTLAIPLIPMSNKVASGT